MINQKTRIDGRVYYTIREDDRWNKYPEVNTVVTSDGQNLHGEQKEKAIDSAFFVGNGGVDWSSWSVGAKDSNTFRIFA